VCEKGRERTGCVWKERRVKRNPQGESLRKVEDNCMSAAVAVLESPEHAYSKH